MTKEQELIADLQNGNKTALAEVYTNFREEFVLFSKKYALPEDDALDIFQDSIIALFENAQKKKLDTLKSSVKTYLFAIGKYKIYKVLKTRSTGESAISDELLENLEFNEPDTNDELTIKMQKAYKNLGEQCKKVLRLSFYEGKTNEEIVEELNYTSKDVLKSQKSRCIKKLKELIESP